MSPLLRFEDVSLHRGGRLLFEGLSLALAPGEALHVAGPNGTGYGAGCPRTCGDGDEQTFMRQGVFVP